MRVFLNRKQAGMILAEQLISYKNRSDVIVLALPRGGVPVGYEVAKKLAAPLDVFIVRKLGVPGHEELAMGAISNQGKPILNCKIVESLYISQKMIDEVIKAEKQELYRREIVYRGTKSFPNLTNKIIILVDDGVATGATMRAAIEGIQQQKPAKIVVAVPVISSDIYDELTSLVDELVSILKPKHFGSVGMWYTDFTQTTDEEVRELLAKTKQGTTQKSYGYE